MKKFLTVLCLLGVWGSAAFGAAAPKLPDNIYFRAMQDEMKRTLKELRAKDSPAPYYAAYKLERRRGMRRTASFGALYPFEKEPDQSLSVMVVLGVGSDKNDQLGFENERFYYEPARINSVPDSYDGIRQALWRLTDSEFLVAADSYVKKRDYKRRKMLPDTLPDVTPAPQGTAFETVDGFVFPEPGHWEEIVKTLSAKGKKFPRLENFTVSAIISRYETYYLNSLGGAYQIPLTQAVVELKARFRNADGVVQEAAKQVIVTDLNVPDEKLLAEKTDAFLHNVSRMYNARRAEAYLGPVLFRPQAAAQFMNINFGWNVENIKPLLSNSYEQDPSAGQFRDKKGMRVVSNVVDVSDKPLLREYKGKPLFFMPVDDEGVPAQELRLTSLGRLRVLPLSRRPLEKGHVSNGHARMFATSYPRESLTNMFIEPKTPLPEESLEEEFLALCRDWELEYCYEVETLQDRTGVSSNRAWRVYAEDGRREPAYGLDLQNLSPRSLRDIAAAGADEDVFYPDPFRRNAVIAPSLLLEEAEILPLDVKPEKPPFVPKP